MPKTPEPPTVNRRSPKATTPTVDPAYDSDITEPTVDTDNGSGVFSLDDPDYTVPTDPEEPR